MAVLCTYQQIEGNNLVRTGINDQKYPQYRHDELWQRTGMPTYPRFMNGGGYVVSDDVLYALFNLLEYAGTEVLDRGPEDAGLGFYFATMNLRRINSTGFWYVHLYLASGSAQRNCLHVFCNCRYISLHDFCPCNRTRDPKRYNGVPNGFPMHDVGETAAVICGSDAPLVIHHVVKTPESMRRVGDVLRNCTSTAV